MQISFKSLLLWSSALLFSTLTLKAQPSQDMSSGSDSLQESVVVVAEQDSIFGYGIDISHYNPEPDWEALDVDFVIMKASEGVGYVDPTFGSRRDKCRKAGIPAGAYHYFLGREEGKSEFNNFFSTVGMEIDLRPTIDLEKIPKGVDKRVFLRNLDSFITAAYDTYGVMPIIYSKEKFYSEILEEMLDDKWKDKGLVLWIGDKGRDYESFGFRPAIHQKEIRKINGINGNVDFNELHIPLYMLLLP